MPLANGFVERMAAGRERAQHMRNRGLATGGKAIKRSAYGPAPDSHTWEFSRACAVTRWQSARADAIEQFRFDVHGNDWADLK